MKRLTILLIVIVFIGISPSLVQYGCFMVAKDFSTQQVPFIIETKRMLESGIPFWSWNSFIGVDFLGSYSFYTITSPFVWFACMFPYEHILTGITIALFLKILCAGWFSYLYFRKISISRKASVIGGLLYALSSFSISNIGYYHFLEPLICFPILLYGIEKFLRRERYGELLLSFSVFLVVFINYYFIPGSLICGFLYTICRMKSKDVSIPFTRFAYALFLVAIGVLACSFILAPTVLVMEGNERIEAKSETWLPFYFERARVLFMPKLQEQANPMLLGTGWNSNAVNLSVIGMLLAIIYCIRHNDWPRWLILIVMAFYFSPLNGVFSLFTNPTYTRWAYALTLFLIIPSLKFIDGNERLKLKHLIVYICLTFGFVGMHYLYSNWEILKTGNWPFNTIDYADNALILFVFALSIVLLIVFYKNQTPKRLLACIVVFSCIYFPIRTWMVTDSYFHLTYTKEKRQGNKTGYIERYVLNNSIPRVKDNSFKYRTDFITQDNNIYQNLALLKNRPSVQSYISSCYHISREILSTSDTLNTPGYSHPNCYIDAFDALMSVKEIVENHDPNRITPLDFPKGEVLSSNKNYTIYANPHYIPMGFVYDSYINASTIDSMKIHFPNSNIPLQLLANLSVESKDEQELAKYLRRGQTLESNNIDSIVNARRQICCNSFSGTSSGFNASINSPKDAVVFFSVPASKGFRAFVDGNPTKIFKTNSGLSSIIINKGQHQIQFSYFPPGLKIGGIISLAALFCGIICHIFLYHRKQRH